MSETTVRDRAWLVVIDALREQESITATDVQDRADVSRPVARGVLHAAEEDGLLTRESERSHTYEPAMWLIRAVEDPSYRRAVETLIEEEQATNGA